MLFLLNRPAFSFGGGKMPPRRGEGPPSGKRQKNQFQLTVGGQRQELHPTLMSNEISKNCSCRIQFLLSHVARFYLMGSWWWVSCELKFSVVVFGWKNWVWGGTASGCTLENCMAGWLASEKNSQWSSMHSKENKCRQGT